MIVFEVATDREMVPLRYFLEPGDAIYYHGLTPHRFFSLRDQDLTLMSPAGPPVADWRPDAT
jgi:hypothetical protein